MEIQKHTPAEIEKITDLKYLSEVKDVAEAAVIFYKAQDAIEKAQKAQEIRLRCVRQAGVILLDTPREPGISPSSRLTRFQEALDEAGISRQTASTWQKVAGVSDEKFEEYFTEGAYRNWEYNIGGLLSFSGQRHKRSFAPQWEGELKVMRTNARRIGGNGMAPDKLRGLCVEFYKATAKWD